MTPQKGVGGVDCEVLIAGGGMVGASLAVALAGLPLRVTLVEAIPAGTEGQPSFDARTTALSRSSQHILSTLGVWDSIETEATGIRQIHVSELGRLGTAVLDAEEEGGESLGYLLENRILGAKLWQTLADYSNVTVRTPATVTSVLQGTDALSVSVEQDGATTTLRTRLLVVADGARSSLREAVGIGARTRPYEQIAIVGNVACAGLSGQPRPSAVAYERFTPEGPLALLPAGGERYVFVLTRAAASAEEVFALPEAEFRQLLQREFGFRLGRFTRLGQRNRYPLALVEAEQVTTHRVALIGNAAHSLHPVAGQGYNLGLRDAAVLAELVAEEARQGQGPGGPDPGQEVLLTQYAQWRRADQRKVVAFTDGLIRLFDLPRLGSLRGLGLLLLDTLPGAKRLLARQTMGLAGRRTKLVRGLPL